ncbi:hypothetical protein COCCADRAFT_82989 [Bipolaris zeicola 26-R-13]|uniref:Uncharacterized protein n=1 Tax=Cochliobolus carbonum (strain 26-R-13) TaxID=930089 RepID=W6Z4B7_COCC2|nr:uncharacterized protein COCCADRAFT_82989 [Bipolaris zeicola 26-R-13]EUC38536.1 hypothetical protein COCCADRAFT_82989 [Bipolaris zeicola 26-R-13]
MPDFRSLHGDREKQSGTTLVRTDTTTAMISPSSPSLPLRLELCASMATRIA